MLRRQMVLAAALAAVLGALSGCVSSGRINAWPLYFSEARQVQGENGPEVVRTTEVLYPFFSREQTPRGSWHAVRPLYNYDYENATGQHRVQYLWPLGLYFKDHENITRFRLFPLWGYVKEWNERYNRPSSHTSVLFLLHWGNDAAGGPYAALFPLGGVTHGVLADTWSFVLFPLYSYYRHGDYVRHDFPWPFFGFGRTPDRSRVMWRAWPFYVSQRKDTPAQFLMRQDAAWPVVRWHKIDFRGHYYYTITAVTPLFSSLKTWDRTDKLIAWHMSVLGISFGNDTREKPPSTGWSGLWTLFKGSSDEKKDETRIFPFYWRTVQHPDQEAHPERTWTRYRVPWPLVWLDYNRLHDGVYHKGILVAPLYWHFTDVYTAKDGTVTTNRKISLWPLATWQRDVNGGNHVWVVSNAWNDTTQGYKRNYRAFFDIFQYHSDGKGEREIRLVWRLFHQRRGPLRNYLSVMGLFTYDSYGDVVGEEGKYFEALFGLVKKSWTDTESRWRICYIPLGASRR